MKKQARTNESTNISGSVTSLDTPRPWWANKNIMRWALMFAGSFIIYYLSYRVAHNLMERGNAYLEAYQEQVDGAIAEGTVPGISSLEGSSSRPTAGPGQVMIAMLLPALLILTAFGATIDIGIGNFKGGRPWFYLVSLYTLPLIGLVLYLAVGRRSRIRKRR